MVTGVQTCALPIYAIFESLQRAGRNVTRAAKSLGVSRMTLYRLMAKHGIDP